MIIIRRIWRMLRRNLKIFARLRKLKNLGLIYVKPNFLYHASLPVKGSVIDVGCSYEADFSLYMIERHGLQAYGVDPTRKHRKKLEKLEQHYKGNFHHLPVAIGAFDGSIKFHESVQNESGSILFDHFNIQRDEVVEYEVEIVGLKTLLTRIGVDHVAILKLDLEGAEYDLLENLKCDETSAFDQIFVEFHHNAVDKYSENDTEKLVGKITGFGYKSYSLDDINYLFYREK